MKFRQNHQNVISCKLFVIQAWLTPHFNWKVHFPVSVSYQTTPINVTEMAKMTSFAKYG